MPSEDGMTTISRAYYNNYIIMHAVSRQARRNLSAFLSDKVTNGTIITRSGYSPFHYNRVVVVVVHDINLTR